MKIQLSVAIMGVPQRQKHIQHMLEALHYPARVFIDPHPSRRNWENAKRAYLSHAPGATHHLVLQDDLGFGPDLVQTVEALLDALPDQVIGLYNPISSEADASDAIASAAADRVRHRWVRSNAIWGAAVVAPVTTHLRWIRWASQNVDEFYPWEDKRLTFYLEATGQKAWYPIPSLVQHLGALDSTLGYSSQTKVSHCYLGDDVALAGLNWRMGVDQPLEHTVVNTGDRYVIGLAPKDGVPEKGGEP